MSDATSPLPLLGRAVTAGGAAGLATGLFSLLLAEPLMDRAIVLEEARSAAEENAHQAAAGAAAHHEELFSRSAQHFGLVVTAVVAGLALGVLFAVAYALVHRRTGYLVRAWPRALAFCAAAFVAVSLLPALRYPAAPPGVGDSATVANRQSLWLAAVVIGVLGMVLAWQVYVRLAGRPDPVRHGAVFLTGAATLAVLFLLPGNPDEVPVPATLLWDFRVVSLGSHLLWWVVFAAVFGGLGLRAARGPAGAQDLAVGGLPVAPVR
ncbi:CbtA family protein [Streptomyces candidus]|uniref:Putative cobalt transporter CbtA n=1 Tax=Streptomyces candidus TaxID=67283 RepID=A0A7X0LQE4_9ACTN|nr:CbtA family protein [Streptomyces candidus]MBB6436962.1 putative cobalt transporter CbtA [Streptomyces candidus]